MATPRVAVKRKPGRKPGNKYSRAGLKLPVAQPGPLTPRGKTGPESHLEAAGEHQRALRRVKVGELYEQELTMDQIGRQLGVAPSTVWKDLQKIHAEWRAARIASMETRKLREERLTFRNDRAILPHLYGRVPGRRRVVGKGKRARVIEEPPDPGTVVAAVKGAHQRLTDSIRVRAELFGLNAPAKVAMTDPSGERRYHELSDEELDRLIQQKERLLGEGVTVEAQAPSTRDGNGQ